MLLFGFCFAAQAADEVCYQYYHGNVSGTVRNIESTNLVSSGTQDNFNINTNRQRGNRFSFLFKTDLTISMAGTYTFFTSSDDGSLLFIDGALVVDNDGDHANQERSGAANLTAGTHEVIVGFYENSGAQVLDVSWQGPDTSNAKQSLNTQISQPSNCAISIPVPPPNSCYAYYQGSVSANTYNLNVATFIRDGFQAGFSINDRDVNSNYGFIFHTEINITTPGNYTFYTRSDDGSLLFVDGQLVVDNNGNHGVRERSGTISLSSGVHSIIVGMHEAFGGEFLSASIQGPDTVNARVNLGSYAELQIPANCQRYFPVDISVTKDDGMTDYTPGATATIVIVVTNNGPAPINNVTIEDIFPTLMSMSAAWTCSATAGSSCSAASGGGVGATNVNLSANFAANGVVTINVPVQYSETP